MPEPHGTTGSQVPIQPLGMPQTPKLQGYSAKGVWVGDTARGSMGALERVGPVKSQPVADTAVSHSFWVCPTGDEPGLKAWV